MPLIFFLPLIKFKMSSIIKSILEYIKLKNNNKKLKYLIIILYYSNI